MIRWGLKNIMRLAASSVALAALLAVSTPVLAAPAAAASAATTTQAEPLRGAPVSELIARVDIPWKRFQLDNGLAVTGENSDAVMKRLVSIGAMKAN